jgi:hypothetical protein
MRTSTYISILPCCGVPQSASSLLGIPILPLFTYEAHNIRFRFELMGEPQRDLTPEQAATQLRDLPSVHYLDAKPKL